MDGSLLDDESIPLLCLLNPKSRAYTSGKDLKKFLDLINQHYAFEKAAFGGMKRLQ